jgi:hypothetical protein
VTLNWLDTSMVITSSWNITFNIFEVSFLQEYKRLLNYIVVASVVLKNVCLYKNYEQILIVGKPVNIKYHNEYGITLIHKQQFHECLLISNLIGLMIPYNQKTIQK